MREGTKGIAGIKGIKAEDIAILDGVKWIGDEVFSGKDLNRVTLPDSLRYIGEKCFDSCSAETVVLPKQIDYLGTDAFAYSKITQIVLPENLTENLSLTRRLIDDYIYFFNHQRNQLDTKLTPFELRSQFCSYFILP